MVPDLQNLVDSFRLPRISQCGIVAMDRTRRITYIGGMSSSKSIGKTNGKVTLRQLGGFRGLIRNPGLTLFTLRRGRHVGTDEQGNQYYQRRSPPNHAA